MKLTLVPKSRLSLKPHDRLHRITMSTGILFLIPALIFIIFSIFIPTIWTFALSFLKWDGMTNYEWVGAKNYIQVITDDLTKITLSNSVFLGVISTLIAVCIGVLLSAFIYPLGRREGTTYRLILFMPTMIPLAIVALLFSFIYSPEMGLINQFLRLVGLDSLTSAWLEKKSTVMWSIIIVGIWRIAGLTMMLCFAALQSIPNSLLESSRLEGASYFKQWIHIIFPLIKPIIRLAAIFTLVIQFKTYDLVYVLTGGGPGDISKTVPLHMIDTAFIFNEFGASSAMGFLLTIIVMFCIFGLNYILKGEQYEY
jgi:ABC-type sugar transport system permease subunit